MRLVINGEEKQVPDPAGQAGFTIRSLLLHLGLSGPVAVEVNRTIVPRAEHEQHALHDGDALEIVHFVGGG